MESSEREVTLKLTSSPLRFVYLVSSKKDLINAVSLYTHILGGAANSIFPMPENQEQVNTLKLVLSWINPDYIFIPKGEASLELTNLLEEYPVNTFPISKEAIIRHIDSSNPNLILTPSGNVSHIGLAIAKLRPDINEVCITNEGSPFELEMGLQNGITNQFYQNYLIKQFGATTLAISQTIEQLIKTNLLTSQLQTPISLTMLKTRKEWEFNHYITQTNDEETLCIFLNDGEDIGLLTAFWNCRWLFPYNKIILPKDLFLNNFQTHIHLIQEVLPSIRALMITVPINKSDALALYSVIKNTFIQVGKEVLVKVIHRDFRFDSIPASVYYGQSINFTRIIAPDDSVRFEPPVPYGHENTDFAFSYKVEVQLVSGRKLSMPFTKTASILLTNELWRIENVNSNLHDLGNLWLRQSLTVRACAKGITGIAQSGKECRFYIHPDDIVIKQWLKYAGFEVKPNKHTRYIKGCIKRFGGFKEVLNLLNKQGADILSSLVVRKAEQGGLYSAGIINFLKKERALSPKDAQQVVDNKLEALLRSGLVRRGYCLTCPTCNLKDWYPITDVNEFVECRGCAENFQLPVKGLQFAYKPNELTVRLIEEGGLAVLMSASLFNQIPVSGFIQFGGELWRSTDKNNFAEIDLFWLTDEAFTITECKSYNTIGQKELIEIEQSLTKTINVIKLIAAQIIILGIVTNSLDLSDLFNLVASISLRLKEQGIGLHLVVNGKLYLWANLQETNPQKVRIEDLKVGKQLPIEEYSIGESPGSYTFSILKETFDWTVLQKWKQELTITKL